MRQQAAVEEVGPHKGNNKVISTTSIFVFGLSGNSVTDWMRTVAHITYMAACDSQYKFSSKMYCDAYMEDSKSMQWQNIIRINTKHTNDGWTKESKSLLHSIIGDIEPQLFSYVGRFVRGRQRSAEKRTQDFQSTYLATFPVLSTYLGVLTGQNASNLPQNSVTTTAIFTRS